MENPCIKGWDSPEECRFTAHLGCDCGFNKARIKDIDMVLPIMYCSCTNALRCFNRDGKVINILCRLKHNEAETLVMWAQKVVKTTLDKEDSE